MTYKLTWQLTGNTWHSCAGIKMQVYYNYHARFDTEYIATGTKIGISIDMTVNSQ
jgi:hypothetical protein